MQEIMEEIATKHKYRLKTINFNEEHMRIAFADLYETFKEMQKIVPTQQNLTANRLRVFVNRMKGFFERNLLLAEKVTDWQFKM